MKERWKRYWAKEKADAKAVLQKYGLTLFLSGGVLGVFSAMTYYWVH